MCASYSEHYLIAGEGKGGLICDLSVPRNVDPDIKGAFLMNIEQIHQLIEKKQKDQTAYFRESERFIEENALYLARLYRAKMEKKIRTQHVLEIGGRESHLGCFPFR